SPRHHRPTVRWSLPIASASSSCDIPERASNSLNSTAFTKSSLRKIEKILALRWSNHKVQNVPNNQEHELTVDDKTLTVGAKRNKHGLRCCSTNEKPGARL